jgi:hypothetical protein
MALYGLPRFVYLNCSEGGGIYRKIFFIFPFLHFSGHFAVFRITFTTSELLYSFGPILYFNGFLKIQSLYQCDLP